MIPNNLTAPPPHSRCQQPTRSALLQARRALVRVGCTLFALALGGCAAHERAFLLGTLVGSVSTLIVAISWMQDDI